MERTGCGIVVPAWGDAGSCSGSPESDSIGAPFLPTGQVDISKWGLVFPPAKGRWHPCLTQIAFVWSGAVLVSYPSVRLSVLTQMCQELVTPSDMEGTTESSVVKRWSDSGGPVEMQLACSALPSPYTLCRFPLPWKVGGAL